MFCPAEPRSGANVPTVSRTYKTTNPDLRARAEIVRDRAKSPLRTTIWKVAVELNPHVANPQNVELHFKYSKDPQQFAEEVRAAQSKLAQILRQLQEAQTALEQVSAHREQETEPRWQANCDLMLAQVIAYQGRIVEYDLFLKRMLEDPPAVPLTKAPNKTLVHFSVSTIKGTLSEDALAYVEARVYRVKLVFILFDCIG